jgi:hypothetical protein
LDQARPAFDRHRLHPAPAVRQTPRRWVPLRRGQATARRRLRRRRQEVNQQPVYTEKLTDAQTARRGYVPCMPRRTAVALISASGGAAGVEVQPPEVCLHRGLRDAPRSARRTAVRMLCWPRSKGAQHQVGGQAQRRDEVGGADLVLVRGRVDRHESTVRTFRPGATAWRDGRGVPG